MCIENRPRCCVKEEIQCWPSESIPSSILRERRIADANEEESMSDGSENEATLSEERPPEERPSVGEKAESADTSQEKSMSDRNENKAALRDEQPPVGEKVLSDKFASEEQFQNVWNQKKHILVNSVMSSKSPVNTSICVTHLLRI